MFEAGMSRLGAAYSEVPRACATIMASAGLWLALSTFPIVAQTSGDDTKAAQPTPVTQPRSTTDQAAPTALNSCPNRPPAGIDEAAANIVISLDPQTLWRPRGGNVNFVIKGRNGDTIQVQRVQVCMGWSQTPLQSASVGNSRTVEHALVPAPDVRSLDTDKAGAVFSATVPDLVPVPLAWPFHLTGDNDVGFTAFSTVPVADMVVSVTLSKPASGPGFEQGAAPPVVLVSLPVGVTSVVYAVVVVVICLGLFFLVAWIFARRTQLLGKNVLLKLISSQDGFASLSQFQIVLWTMTIGVGAVYVMTLSGNLIDLTNGTLVLLGIAGGAALLARIPTSSTLAPVDPNMAPPARQPLWSDLVVTNRTIDITRVQMLVFTLISAAFVILKVGVSYVIPVIPDNFLLLMGISNGIYVAGRQLPTQTDANKKA